MCTCIMYSYLFMNGKCLNILCLSHDPHIFRLFCFCCPGTFPARASSFFFHLLCHQWYLVILECDNSFKYMMSKYIMYVPSSTHLFFLYRNIISCFFILLSYVTSSILFLVILESSYTFNRSIYLLLFAIYCHHCQ